MMSAAASLLAFLLAATATAADPAKPILPPAAELYAQIAHEDAALFGAVFDACDADAVAKLVTDDFEFYHDKWGQIAASGAQFVDLIRKQCQRQAQGIDYRARRELVEGSLKVHPLAGYGAIETGLHRFYRLTPGKPDQMTETAEFFQLWRLEPDGSWKLARVFSYDHADAPTAH